MDGPSPGARVLREERVPLKKSLLLSPLESADSDSLRKEENTLVGQGPQAGPAGAEARGTWLLGASAAILLVVHFWPGLLLPAALREGISDGGLPGELVWRLAWMAGATLWLVGLCRWVWRAEPAAGRGDGRP